MVTEVDLEPMLSRLYEAALEPLLWPAAWAEATAATGAAAPSLILVAHNEGPAPFAMAGWDRHSVRAVAAPAAVSPDAAPVAAAPVATDPVVAVPEAVPLAANVHPAARPAAVTALSMVPRTRRTLAGSSGGAQPAELPAPLIRAAPAAERTSIAKLHLQRAMRVRARLSIARTVLAASAAALQAADIGVVLVTAGGRIVYADPAAQRLAGIIGLQLDSARGGLQTLEPSTTTYLHGLVHDAAAGGAGGDMLMRTPEGPPVALSVCALQRTDEPDPMLDQDLGQPLEQDAVHVMLMLRRLTQTVACPRRVAALFGFTQSEADVAVAAAAGHPMAEIAVQRGVTVKVAQAQLRAALGKAGVLGVQELAMLFARLA